MKKQIFLDILRAKLKGLPKKEVEECLNFYSEMIDDRIEEGLSEEDATLSVGDVSKIALDKLAEERSNSNERKAEGKKLALIIATSPLWVPLAISALAIVFSLFASAWAVIVSLWAVFTALCVSAPLGVILGIAMFFNGSGISGAICFSIALISFSLAIFSFPGCLWLTKKSVFLTKNTFNYIAKIFMRKENRK